MMMVMIYCVVVGVCGGFLCVMCEEVCVMV